MTVDWTNGNGTKRIVKINTSNSFTAPTNGNSPTANATYSSGEQVVYNGTGNSVTVDGLSANTTYWFRVYEFDCTGTLYSTATGTNNPRSQATPAPAPSLSTTPTSYAFGTLVNGSTNTTLYTVDASNLTAGVSVSSNNAQFTVSNNSGGPFASTTTLTSAGGIVYLRFIPTGGAASATISHTSTTASANFTVTGTGQAACTTPSPATGLTFGTVTTSSIAGSFTGSGASGYYVIRSTSSTPPTVTDGVAYTGNATYVVLQSSSSTSFSTSGLSANTPYYFYIYAYNNTSCVGGPKYATVLSGSQSTNALPTTVQFSTASASVTEGTNTTYTITVSITNPSSTNATSATVSLGSGNGRVGGFTSQVLTFPAGSSSSQTINLTITNNTTCDGNEVLNFGLGSISGGTSASAGTNNAFALTVNDDDGTNQTILSEDAEDQSLAQFTVATDWVASSTGNNINGNYSLRRNASGAGNGSLSFAYPAGFDMNDGNMTWQFLMKKLFNTSSSNKFAFFMGATQSQLTTSTVDGYAVGVNQVTNNNLLTLYTVTNNTYTEILTTTTDIQTDNDGFAIKVTRTPAGEWELLFNSNPSYTGMTSLGTVTNNTAYTITYTGIGTVYGSAAASALYLDDILVTQIGCSTTPLVTTNTTGPLAFGNVLVNTTSATQNYTVSGVNLGTNPLVVTAPTNFAVSTSSTGPFTSSVNLTPTGGTVGNTTIYVVYKPTSAGAQSGNVSNTSATSGTNTVNVAVTGTGVVPNIVTSVSSLTSFGNVVINTTSSQQSYTVSGTNLGTNPIAINAPSGFGISTTSGGPYTSSLSLTPSGGSVSTTTIYVVFQPTTATSYSGNITHASTGATTKNVAVSGTGIVPPPTITTSTSGPLAFGNVTTNTTSAQQTYTVSAVNLTANLVVTAPASFGISTTTGGPYTSSVTLTPSSGTVNTTTIYVVFQPTANGAQSGNITNASTGATTKNVAVSGTGLSACAVPANQATNLVLTPAATSISGTFTAAVGGADGYLVLVSPNTTLLTGPVDGVSYTVGSTLGGGTVVSTAGTTSFTATGLNVTTTYYFFIYAFNNTNCTGGPIYKKPLLGGNATTLASPFAAFDNFDRSAGNVTGIPSSGGTTAWTEVEGAAARVAIFNNKLVISGGSPAGADAAVFNMTGKYATTFNTAQSDLVWIFNMASTRNGPSGFLSSSSTFGTAMILGGTDVDVTDAGDGYAVILGNSGSPDYVKIVRYTGGLMNPMNNGNLTDIATYTASTGDQDIMNIMVEYSPTTKIWKLYVNRPGGTASYNTSGTQPSFTFPDPTAATYGTPATSAADNNALLNGPLLYSGFLFNHGTASDEYATFDNFNIPTAQPCQNSWTGAVSNNWFTPANWSCGYVPASTDDVVIPNTSTGSNRYPVIAASLNATAAVKNITINTGASVTINANVIAGIPVTSNDLEIHGNLTNNGSADWGTGTVTFKTGSGQTVNGSNNFHFLAISNSAGVAFASGTQKVYGVLSLTSGNLSTNGLLTIGSNATYTGLIDEFSAGYTGTLTGNITVERYTTNTADNFFYIGAPVGGAQISGWGDDFSLATMNGATDGSQVLPTSSCSLTNLQAGSPYGGLFDYRESAVNTCNLQGWHVRTTGAVVQGQGFIGRMPAGTTLDLTGTFVTGQTVTRTGLTRRSVNNALPSLPGMNLVANPFAAPIDWQAVYAANSSAIEGTAHFYQTSGPLAGTYVAMNNTIGGNEIGSSQAFIVQARTNNVNMVFTDGMKRNGQNQYLRTAPAYDQLLTLDVAGNGFADRAYVAFGSSFTSGFDTEYDGRKLMSKPNQPSLYVNDGTENYSIYAQPGIAQVQIVPVDFVAGTNGNFTITAALGSFDATAMVYLEDRLLGTMTDLRTAGSYSFSATTGDAAGRFALHFYPAMMVNTADATCAGADGSIELNQPGTTEWSMELLDANGNTVASNPAFNGSQTVTNLGVGTYTLNLLHASGYAVSKTYLVTGPAPVSVSFAAPTNAVEGDDVTFASTASNATSYQWNFGDGTTSTDANPVHAYTLAGTYTVELIATNGSCQQSFTQTITVEEKVANGMDNLLGGTVKIYAYGTDVNIILSNQEHRSTVDVFDLMGRKVIETQELDAMNGSFVIGLESVVNGYYFVRLNNGQDNIIQKVLVNSGK